MNTYNRHNGLPYSHSILNGAEILPTLSCDCSVCYASRITDFRIGLLLWEAVATAVTLTSWATRYLVDACTCTTISTRTAPLPVNSTSTWSSRGRCSESTKYLLYASVSNRSDEISGGTDVGYWHNTTVVKSTVIPTSTTVATTIITTAVTVLTAEEVWRLVLEVILPTEIGLPWLARFTSKIVLSVRNRYSQTERLTRWRNQTTNSMYNKLSVRRRIRKTLKRNRRMRRLRPYSGWML